MHRGDPGDAIDQGAPADPATVAESVAPTMPATATTSATAGGPVTGDGAPVIDEGAPGTGNEPWRRPRPFSRPMWYPVAGASAVLALLAGGGMTLLTLSHGPAPRPVADDCGLVTCGASLPAAVTGAAPPSTAVRSTAPAARRHRPPLAPPTVLKRGARAPGNSRRPHHRRTAPSPPTSGTPPAGPVAVTYTLDDGGGPWHHGFRAHLTIVNSGGSPISGWTIQVSLPGDEVSWVSAPGDWGPFANWQFTGGTLALTAVSGGETLAPGATEIVPIFGEGAATAPAGCTFNGSACQP